MKPFKGFPAKMQFTPIPNIFFSQLLPEISDTAELITTLHMLVILYRKRGYPRFASFTELSSDSNLMNSLKKAGASPRELLCRTLKMATQRGTIIHLALEREGERQDIYFLNTESDRKAVNRIKMGELELTGLKVKEKSEIHTEEPADIFTLYEENIGMLTPMLAEELKEAENLYPAAWINKAIKEAVSLNKRNWRYISRILEHWHKEGKSHGAHQRDLEKEEQTKYINQKYGHIVRH